MHPVSLPNEADAVLVIDSDAMLPNAFAFQRFQPIARRGPQVTQADGRRNLIKLATGNDVNSVPPLFGTCFKELFRISVFEALDHLQSGYNASHDM
jgi:hypothetical protein